MTRRPGRATFALAVSVLLLILFGMARVAAPVSALGLVFDEPLGFGAVAALVSVAGAAVLFVRPLEVGVAGTLAGPSRAPAGPELERLRGLRARAGARAGVDPTRLIVRVQRGSGVNASAGAAHLLFVTVGALELPDARLEAILAHELCHHGAFTLS